MGHLLIPLRKLAGGHIGAVEGYEKAPLQQIDEQDGDIAAPHQGLGMVPDESGVQIGYDPLAAVAAPRAQDGLDPGIQKHRHELPGPPLILARQVEVPSFQE